MNKREHVFIESLYNDIQEIYSKNIRENYVLYSPVFCPNTGEYGVKKNRIRGGFLKGFLFIFLFICFLLLLLFFLKKALTQFILLVIFTFDRI